jgi:hypothetical protein
MVCSIPARHGLAVRSLSGWGADPLAYRLRCIHYLLPYTYFCLDADISSQPGWKLRDADMIDNDIRGFKKMFLKRNHPKFIQTSLHCVQSWRANCDISILIYESDPKNPDPNEIAKVTDYVVNYACKGNLTLAVKKKQVKDFTLR